MIKIGQQYFEIIEEYRSCFDEELFASRYSDILDKYDFIVGILDMITTIKRFYKDTNKINLETFFEYSRLYIRILQFRLSLFCITSFI